MGGNVTNDGSNKANSKNRNYKGGVSVEVICFVAEMHFGGEKEKKYVAIKSAIIAFIHYYMASFISDDEVL